MGVGRLLWPFARRSSTLRFAYHRPINTFSTLVVVFVFKELFVLAIAGQLTPSPTIRSLFLLAVALVGTRVRFTHELPAKLASTSTAKLIAAIVLSEKGPDE